MSALSPLAKKLSGYLLVGPIWALAVLLSSFEKDGLPHTVSRTLFALGYVMIGMVTFGWGGCADFPRGRKKAGSVARTFYGALSCRASWLSLSEWSRFLA